MIDRSNKPWTAVSTVCTTVVFDHDRIVLLQDFWRWYTAVFADRLCVQKYVRLNVTANCPSIAANQAQTEYAKGTFAGYFFMAATT